MPLQQTSGNVTADAYGGGVAAKPNYIEDVFSTWLYAGAAAPQTITNNIDLSTKGGLVWIKNRTSATDHVLTDTVRGVDNLIYSDSTNAQTNGTWGVHSFNTTGFGLIGADQFNNNSGQNYASWTFRKQPKFFDVVTYTGTGSVQTIAHSLGSVPGCIIVKNTDTGSYNWTVYHKSVGNTSYLSLNTTDQSFVDADVWNNTTPTSSVFTVGSKAYVNRSGYSYVAYVFADNAGGFGLTGTDNVISCGSFTTDSSGKASVTLGYEPQWLMTKTATTASSGSWYMQDNMRGWVANNPGSNDNKLLYANTSDAESGGGFASLNATGFTFSSGGYAPWANQTFIYIAIRRGPMKVPTDATKVFSPNAVTSGTVTTNFPVDFQMLRYRSGDSTYVVDRLRGVNAPTDSTTAKPYLLTDSTAAENTYAATNSWSNTGFSVPSAWAGNSVYWSFVRAPSFFDEVCYTGTGTNITLKHNLTVAPELIILKNRTPDPGAPLNYWLVGSGFTSTNFTRNWLQLTNAGTSYLYTSAAGFSGQPTATTIQVSSGWSQSATTYVAYLFATCANVSKVGSYTGNGTTQTIDCGFTGGARFVLIKQTDATGDWYVYDTARGMTTLTDPYLLMNSNVAETATLGSVTTVSTGFALNASILAAINTNGASYIFLAIA